jgi:hypothetical protein
MWYIDGNNVPRYVRAFIAYPRIERGGYPRFEHKGERTGMVERVILSMIAYFCGDAKRVNHLLKVFGFAKAIGSAEKLDAREQEILDIATLTHDIGIKNSEAKYNSAAGGYQQTEGPPEAEKLLRGLGVQETVIGRVCWLIAHHHTFGEITEIDYQILIEADFIVNAFEENLAPEAIGAFVKKYFKTDSGKTIMRSLYGFEG